jgi:predicted component of type VI protein secretion system
MDTLPNETLADYKNSKQNLEKLIADCIGNFETRYGVKVVALQFDPVETYCVRALNIQLTTNL